MPRVCEHVHARTRMRTYSGVPPWIFDNPNWIPQLGARRWFSTILALHRSRLSCKIVSPRPRSESYAYEFAIPSDPDSWETIGVLSSHAALSLARFYGISPIWYRPRTRANADGDAAFKDLETASCEMKGEWSVCFNALLAISTGDSAHIEVDPGE